MPRCPWASPSAGRFRVIRAASHWLSSQRTLWAGMETHGLACINDGTHQLDEQGGCAFVPLRGQPLVGRFNVKALTVEYLQTAEHLVAAFEVEFVGFTAHLRVMAGVARHGRLALRLAQFSVAKAPHQIMQAKPGFVVVASHQISLAQRLRDFTRRSRLQFPNRGGGGQRSKWIGKMASKKVQHRL